MRRAIASGREAAESWKVRARVNHSQAFVAH